MTRRHDPRAPKPNPEVGEIKRAMLSHLSEMRKTKDYTELRGHAAILRAHCVFLLDAPEFVQDLKPGPGAAARQMHYPKGGLPEGDFPDPFDDLASTGFFYSGYQAITPLLTQEQRKLYDLYEMPGFVITCYEKLFATAQDTCEHLTSAEALERVRPQLPRNSPDRTNAIFLLLDPLGLDGKTCASLGVASSVARARTTAERIADWLRIRVLVARRVGMIDTH